MRRLDVRDFTLPDFPSLGVSFGVCKGRGLGICGFLGLRVWGGFAGRSADVGGVTRHADVLRSICVTQAAETSFDLGCYMLRTSCRLRVEGHSTRAIGECCWQVVADLRTDGHSERAIAGAVGVSQPTVHRDLERTDSHESTGEDSPT